MSCHGPCDNSMGTAIRKPRCAHAPENRQQPPNTSSTNFPEGWPPGRGFDTRRGGRPVDRSASGRLTAAACGGPSDALGGVVPKLHLSAIPFCRSRATRVEGPMSSPTEMIPASASRESQSDKFRSVSTWRRLQPMLVASCHAQLRLQRALSSRSCALPFSVAQISDMLSPSERTICDQCERDLAKCLSVSKAALHSLL
jgi:hypothetical protein